MHPDAPVQATPLPDVDRSRTRTILTVLVLATFVVILNETIMTNAIPRLMREFDVTASTAQWLSTVFMLTMAVVIPASGWLMERLATRRTFALAMVLFSIGGTTEGMAEETLGFYALVVPLVLLFLRNWLYVYNKANATDGTSPRCGAGRSSASSGRTGRAKPPPSRCVSPPLPPLSSPPALPTLRSLWCP